MHEINNISGASAPQFLIKEEHGRHSYRTDYPTTKRQSRCNQNSQSIRRNRSNNSFGDVSALAARSDGTAVAHLGLLRVWYSCQGGDGGDSYARLDEEDSDGDIPIIGLTGAGYWDFREFGGIPADKSSNSNQSDVNLVVPGAADSGNMYTVIAEFQKIY